MMPPITGHHIRIASSRVAMGCLARGSAPAPPGLVVTSLRRPAKWRKTAQNQRNDLPDKRTKPNGSLRQKMADFYGFPGRRNDVTTKTGSAGAHMSGQCAHPTSRSSTNYLL
jgi:hypothetical protein